MIEKIIRFTCAVCGCHNLEAIGNNARTVTPILKVFQDEPIEYGHSTIADCENVYFQCSKCGEIILDKEGNVIDDDDELKEFLSATGELKETVTWSLEEAVKIRDELYQIAVDVFLDINGFCPDECLGDDESEKYLKAEEFIEAHNREREGK